MILPILADRHRNMDKYEILEYKLMAMRNKNKIVIEKISLNEMC